MTLIVTEDFDGQADGTTVTTSTISADSVSGSGAITHSTTRAITGASSLRVNGTSTHSATWLDTARAESYVSFYFYLPSDPAANSFLAQLRDSVPAVVAQVGFTTAGELRIRNALSTVYTTSGLQNNQWYRADWYVSNTANTQRIRLYTGASLHSSNTADATFDSGNQSYTGGDQSRTDFGAIAGVAGGWEAFGDRLRVDDASMPAPYSAPAAATWVLKRRVGGVAVEHVIERRTTGAGVVQVIKRNG
jgi:hypothetical protein